MGNPRHIGVALAIGISIMAAGVFLFKDSSEAAMQAVAFVGFFTVFAVFHFLDERAKRDRERPQ